MALDRAKICNFFTLNFYLKFTVRSDGWWHKHSKNKRKKKLSTTKTYSVVAYNYTRKIVHSTNECGTISNELNTVAWAESTWFMHCEQRTHWAREREPHGMEHHMKLHLKFNQRVYPFWVEGKRLFPILATCLFLFVSTLHEQSRRA